MTEFSIVQEGYVRGRGISYRASSTCVLVSSGGKRIVVDPGSNPDVPSMVGPCDIVYLTHSHIDHFMNMGRIPHGSMMDRFYTFEDDLLTEHGETIPGTDVGIIPTPGHSVDHSSLVIGRTLIAGDLFWWGEGHPVPASIEELMALPDPFATDLVALARSRSAALVDIDTLVPGHGRVIDIRALR